MIVDVDLLNRASKRWILLLISLCIGNCGLNNGPIGNTVPGPSLAPEASTPDGHSMGARQVPNQVLDASQGIFIQKRGGDRLEFVEWVSESTANTAIRSLRAAGGGSIYFAPGRYVVRHGIAVTELNHLALIAAPGVELVFPARRSAQHIRLTEPVNEGQSQLIIDNTEGVSMGGRYQLFPQERRGGRLLEFSVKMIQGKQITITKPVRFMKHVKAIPTGSVVVEELNFIRIRRSHNVSIQGFTMDGLNRGERAGHTIFSGILVGNDYHGAHAAGAPQFSGLHIVDNRFRNLRGRGIAVYGTRSVAVIGNQFDNIGAQAIEIDHYSSARVARNLVTNATIGIQLDDAFDTRVEQNILSRTSRAIVFLGHFDSPKVNTGNIVTANRITGPGKIGIQLSERARNNVIYRNELTSITQPISGAVENNDVRENITH